MRITSNDPELDHLLVRFHLESGARREGALNLRCRDIDAPRATVWLREKGDSEREQPLSPSLLEHHSQRRGAMRLDDPVLRTAIGAPLSARRYSTIFDRARTCLPWADRTSVSAHVLRHTAITAVGRLAGYPVAQAFAGHSAATVTGRYLHATLAEVAAAVAELTGEDHPLADGHRRVRSCRRCPDRRPPCVRPQPPRELHRPPLDALRLWEGGASLLGGIVVAILVALPEMRRQHLDFWTVMDAAAPGLALGIAIGRVGDLIVGDHLGKQTDFFLGFRCTGADSASPCNAPLGAAVHQPALYDLISVLALLGFLLWLRRRPLATGTLFLAFAAWYEVGRVAEDFFRVDATHGLFLTSSQWAVVVAVLTAVGLLVTGRRPGTRPHQPLEAVEV